MKCLMFMWNLSGLDRFDARLKALAKVGVKFTIIYEVDDLTDPQRENYYSYLKMSKIKFKPYPHYLKWLFSKEHILNQIKNISFDIVFCVSGLWFQYYSNYISKKLNKKYVLFLRGDDYKAPKLQGRNIIKLFIRKYIYKLGSWDCDLVIPISYALLDLAIMVGIDEAKISKVISGGIDTKLFLPMYGSRYKFTAGYAGRINKEKGSEFLLKLIKDNPEIKFNIAGPIQTAFKMPENVKYWGILPHKRMPRFYNDCDVIIMVSKIEGYPRVILEAYACACPILVTPESLPSGCKLYGDVLERDLEAWKKSFRFWESNVGNLLNTGYLARTYSLRFSLETYAEEMRAEFTRAMAYFRDLTD